MVAIVCVGPRRRTDIRKSYAMLRLAIAGGSASKTKRRPWTRERGVRRSLFVVSRAKASSRPDTGRQTGAIACTGAQRKKASALRRALLRAILGRACVDVRLLLQPTSAEPASGQLDARSYGARWAPPPARWRGWWDCVASDLVFYPVAAGRICWMQQALFTSRAARRMRCRDMWQVASGKWCVQCAAVPRAVFRA